MKIINQLKNPTVQFGNLSVGDVFMTLDGDIAVKIHSKTSCDVYGYNMFSFHSNAMMTLDLHKETVPVEVELKLIKNNYELYNKR